MIRLRYIGIPSRTYVPNRYEVWLNDIWKRIHQLKPYKRKETIEELAVFHWPNGSIGNILCL